MWSIFWHSLISELISKRQMLVLDLSVLYYNKHKHPDQMGAHRLRPFKLFDLMSLKIRWYRDICDGLSIISPHIQPSVNPSCSLRCVRFHRCSSCHMSPSDICLGLGSHLWMWWGFFFFRALLLMWTTTCSAEGRSCLQYTPTSFFPPSAWNFMSLSLSSIFHATGRHPRLQLALWKKPTLSQN